MGVIKSVLGSSGSLFRIPDALDYDYQPKVVPYRDKEMRVVANVIRPLFGGRNAGNIFVFGSPGVGKTVAVKNLLKEIEEESDDIETVYLNCWQKNTSFKIFNEICDLLGYKFTQNKRGDELFEIIKKLINKKSGVFVFDEVDKCEEFDFLYNLLGEIYKKSIVLITNNGNWLSKLEDRIKSRLVPGVLEFKSYNISEVRGILKNRCDVAFVPDVWDSDAFEAVVEKTVELGDMRKGMFLLREAGNSAENRSSKKISLSDVKETIEKLHLDFSVNDDSVLNDELKGILELIKLNPNSKIGDLFNLYNEKTSNKMIYKTFQRRIQNLEKGKFIKTEKLTGGSEGKTTIINLNK